MSPTITHRNRSIKDRIGQSFGKLTVIRLAGQGTFGRAVWFCQCACGRTTSICSSNLKKTQSCGCHRKETTRARSLRHGWVGTAEYRAWHAAKSRCQNPKVSSYDDYGGRGITMCEGWRNDFGAFISDVGPRPSAKHSLDRVNPQGNYEPGNVRWATRSEQNINRRPQIKNRQYEKFQLELTRYKELYGPLPKIHGAKK